MARSKTAAGPYRRARGVQPFYVKGAKFAAEDPFIWFDKENGCLRAVVKDMSGELTGGGRCLAFFESSEGVHWSPSAVRRISGAAIRWDDGVVEPFSRIERPQIARNDSGEPIALRVACRPEGGKAAAFSLSVPLASSFFRGRDRELFASHMV